ncbi:hypothetical protein L7F22_003904 [Adiantum nelumboides]|nr:hypothetical protein [Adiantum nelumboides]
MAPDPQQNGTVEKSAPPPTKDPKRLKKEEKKDEDLSEEDLALKQQLELYVERAQDSDPGVQKLALESMRSSDYMACQRRLSPTEIPDLRVCFGRQFGRTLARGCSSRPHSTRRLTGQPEIANSVFLDVLKSYFSDQKTQWERYLPLVEFAYNNTIHSSTGKAPFEIVEGVMKVPPFLSTKDKISEANEYTRDLDTDFAKVRETLQKSQERQKKAADCHRCDLKLKENDWVLLRFDKARLRQKKGKEELSMRYYGPFQITEQINDISFRLRLPDTWKIHNVFHVNL